MKLASQLDDFDQASLAFGIEFDPAEGRTQQEFAEEADINTIVRRFGLTGELPENVRIPQSGDFTGITDYHSALNLIREADEGFMELPAELRARFEHDPGRLMAFLEDANNKEEAIKLGLVNKPPEVTRTAVEAIDALAATLVSGNGQKPA